MGNPWLATASGLSTLAALLHLGCIVGGPAWYRFFGAGDRIVWLAERGAPGPTVFALAIAGVLGVWAACAASGAGLIPRLPLLRPILVLITLVYLGRAVAAPVMMTVMPGRSPAFWLWSSAIVLVIGLVHLAGVWSGWRMLGAVGTRAG